MTVLPENLINNSSPSQEFHHILWNPQVHYRFHKSPPFVPILSQSNPISPLPTDFLTININIILPSTPRFSKWSDFLRFPHHKPACTSFLSYAFHIPRPSRSTRFAHPDDVWRVVRFWRSSLYILFKCPLISSILGPTEFRSAIL